jgi:hypothetical protein
MSETKTIRLGCEYCDRGDCDGITAIQLRAARRAGWQGIRRVQTYAQSCKTYHDPADQPTAYSVLDWETHVGVCPECVARLAKEDAENKARAKAWDESPEGRRWHEKYGAKPALEGAQE